MTNLSCYDLSDDQEFSVLDYLLLEECLSSNADLDEASPFHAHCDFPYGVSNDQDTTRFFIDHLDESQGSFDLFYQSNANFLSFDLKLSGVQLHSVRLAEGLIDTDSIKYIIEQGRVAVVSPTSAHFSKSLNARLLATIYYTDMDGVICLDEVSEVINQNFESIVYQASSSCLEATTTPTSDVALDIDGFHVFPNPSSHTFYIKVASDMKEVSCALYDLNGNKVARLGRIETVEGTVAVSHTLAPGLYFIHFKTFGDNIVQKIIIQ